MLTAGDVRNRPENWRRAERSRPEPAVPRFLPAARATPPNSQTRQKMRAGAGGGSASFLVAAGRAQLGREQCTRLSSEFPGKSFGPRLEAKNSKPGTASRQH